jgi:hypothetical protein
MELIAGFMILVEKDFLSFGHMFAKRSGHLSNEKFFIDKYVQATPQVPSDSPPNSGRSSPSITPYPASVAHSTPSPSSSAAAAARGAFSNMASRISLKPSNSKPPQMKETSPVFHQFLDAVYQLLYIHPHRFEFNERFLKRLLYHAYSCQYGSFLYDSERERVEAKVYKKTHCVWDYFLARRKEFVNPEFDVKLDHRDAVLFPKGDGVRWWAPAWGRTDAEMNGPGRGTTIREDVVKVREERQNKEEKERNDALKERLERVVRTTSPRKELQLFDGVGSSPLRSTEIVAPQDSPTRVPSLRQTEISEDAKEPFVEVDPIHGEPDPVVNAVANAQIGEDVVTALESDDTSVGGSASLVSSAVEDNSLSTSGYVTDPSGVELDPLGGEFEMSSLSLNSTSIRNR